MREEARAMDARMGRIEVEIAQLIADVAQLKTDVAQLKAEVAQLRTEVELLKALVANCATKAELKQVEANRKSWMIGLAISILTVTSGVQFALFTALRQ